MACHVISDFLAKPEGRQCRAPVPGLSMYLRTVGGTPYRDPCSL